MGIGWGGMGSGGGTSAGGGFDWGSLDWGKVAVGAISAAGTIWASKQQKDAQKEQYKYEQRMLEEQRAYQQAQYQQRMNTPAAKLAPFLMKAALEMYAPKMQKYGMNLPLDQIFSALGLGNGQTLMNAMSGGAGSPFPTGSGDSVSPEQRAAIEERKKAVAEKGFQNVQGGGGGRPQIQRLAGMVEAGDDPYYIGGGGRIGQEDTEMQFDQMFANQREYMSGLRDELQGPVRPGEELSAPRYFNETLISPQQMAQYNVWMRENKEEHPILGRIGEYLTGSMLGGIPVLGGILGMIPGAKKGITGKYTTGSDDAIREAMGEPNFWYGRNKVPQFQWSDGTYHTTPEWFKG